MKSYEQIVKDMQDYIKANMDGDNKVTGFHEGSVLLTLIEAFAGELEFIGIDIENDLKKRLIDYVFSYFKFTKRPGQKATIKVKFFCEDEAKSPSESTVSTLPTKASLFLWAISFCTSER